MEAKHTPGPWFIKETGQWPETNHWMGIYSENKKTYWIAKVEGWGEEAEANARLMSAAPEMLEALETLLSAKEMKEIGAQEYPATKEKAWNMARAAITKAKGE